MANVLKNLLGNSSRDRKLSEEVRAVLKEMREERERFEALLAGSETASERLASLSEPIARVGNETGAMIARLESVEQRVAGLDTVAGRIDALDQRSQGLVDHQQEAEERIASSVEDSQKIRAVFEELAQKTDFAESLRTRLEAFLEVEQPFKLLEGEAEAIRGQIDGVTEQLGRLREQHDRLMDAHKLGTSKMEALDRRREELSRDLQDKERRVVDIEHIVGEVAGVRQTVTEVKRSMGSLKTLTESVAQKTAALEGQREAIERSLTQAERLEGAMRQLDAGVRQQQDNEKSLLALKDQVAALAALHEAVLERSSEVTRLQGQSKEQIVGIEDQLEAARGEVKNAVERFDFESMGLESVSQRVADLRSALAEFEARFKSLTESGEVVRELNASTESLSPRIQGLREDVARIDDEMQKLHAIRRELNQVDQKAVTLGAQVARIEQVRPAVETALADIERLGGAQAMVKDTIEQARIAHAEIARMIASQSETRTWLIDTDRTLAEIKTRAAGIEATTPALERVEQQAQRITESIGAIAARRDFLEGLHSRLAEFGTLSASLDERGLSLVARMDAAEQRFVHFATHAEEADRISGTVAGVTRGVQEAAKSTESIRQAVAAIEARCSSVEELAERTRVLKDEIDQRQGALEAAAADLVRTSKLRDEAATSAEQLGALAQRLDEALASAKTWSAHLDEVSGQLADREAGFGTVNLRLGQFEQKLGRWEIVDQQVTRALDQISARQGTVQALQSDLERMFAMAETTCENVRTITAAQRETTESQAVLRDIMGRLEEMRNLAGSLDARERQINQAEERLARAEGFLADVRSGLESLQGQKTLVDQAVEKVGALRFLLKHADAMIEGLRDERKMTSDVQDARAADGEETGNDAADIAQAA